MTDPRPELAESSDRDETDADPWDADPLLDDVEAAQERAAQAERALARVQGSFTMAVGQLVIDAGQSPRRMLALPFALLRMRRSRRSLRTQRASRPVRPSTLRARDASLTINAKRMLLPRRALTSDARASLVVIGPSAFQAALARRAHVSAAMPQDAAALVRSLDPDAVLVHAGAGEPGSPWFPLGDPGEAVRERVLIKVRDECRRLGRPIVLLADPVAAPGLTAFAETCTRVLDVRDSEQVLDLITDLIDGPHA